MNKVSLIDEDSILMARMADFLMEKEKYIVISKNSDLTSFFRSPPFVVNIIITKFKKIEIILIPSTPVSILI